MSFYVELANDRKILRDDREASPQKAETETACRIYRVQAGTYRDRESAAAAAEELKKLGYRAFVL